MKKAIYCDVPGSPCVSKNRVKCKVIFFILILNSSPTVNGTNDTWPRVMSLSGAQGGFVGDPASLAHDNIM